MKLEFDLNEDPGRGNLNLRAYFAAIVGPQRQAHGVRSVKQVPFDQPVLIARNQEGGHGPRCLWVGANLPRRLSGDPPSLVTSLPFWFSSSPALGDNAIYRIVQPFGGNFITFNEVLLPGEELYAQYDRAAGFFGQDPAEKSTGLVVTQVAF